MATRNNKRTGRAGLEVSLVNKDGSLGVYAGEVFVHNNKKLTVVSSTSLEHKNTPQHFYSVWLTKDTFLNIETCKKSEFSRKKLKDLNLTVTIL